MAVGSQDFLLESAGVRAQLELLLWLLIDIYLDSLSVLSFAFSGNVRSAVPLTAGHCFKRQVRTRHIEILQNTTLLCS